jgi:hypothetical protein
MREFQRIEVCADRHCPILRNVLPIVEKHTLSRQRQLCPKGAIGQHLFPSLDRIVPLRLWAGCIVTFKGSAEFIEI